MHRNTFHFVKLLAAVAITGAIVIAAEPAKDAKPVGAPQLKLPPGYTEADMQKCMEACTLAGAVGENHMRLAKDAGVWQGKTTLWFLPGADPMTSECTQTVTPIMDGRFIKVEHAGEMPGMGPYTGSGTFGYENATKKFVGNWIDNHGTGIMTATGELAADGKVLTWTYTVNCPVANKPVTMRHVETTTGPDTRTMEMFGPDPKHGKEFQMMKVEFTRKSAAAAK